MTPLSPIESLAYLQTSRLIIFLLSMSMSRPGVATTTWTPLRTTSMASEVGIPPIAKHDLKKEREDEFNPGSEGGCSA
jgi:hypothetical protein